MSSPSNLTKIPGIGVYPGPVLLVPINTHKIDSIITKTVCIGDLNGVNPFSYRRNEAVGFRTVYLILGRIPPLLIEVKVGDECRLFFFTETIDNQ